MSAHMTSVGSVCFFMVSSGVTLSRSIHLEIRKKIEPGFVAGIVSCHWLPMSCGAGEVTFTQFPKTRFVRDCNVKPADASGHVSARFVEIEVAAMVGLLVLNNWFGPIA